MTLVSAGRIGKPHGLDGSFYVDRAQHPLELGREVLVGPSRHSVERRAGTAERPLIRLSGVQDPRELRGETILVEEELADGEWLASDLLGCTVVGLRPVADLLDGPSCSVLVLEDGRLVPLVSDAIESIDVEAREIRVKPGFLG